MFFQGVFLTNDWVLKPEYGAQLFFFLAFIFPLGYEVYNMHEYVFKKIMYIIHIAPSHAFCIALHVIDIFC